MAEIDNITEINENFDTVKTLLNSIRAQGILNTSDVDKLLSGINDKLEKINTEEDIDIIKAFLTELKQSFDERHSVLISKFGAIESLFSNLLKNSTELPKSSDLKELFDVVATNLSVFSREVVSQKETLTDITLRIDALRTDDSRKNDIIKNITLLRPDLERLNNGFDSIVLSLNDNFKTIVKTISTMDKTEHLDKFADSLSNIDSSSNAILSAIQVLDKKSETTNEVIKNLITKEDLENTEKNFGELRTISQRIADGVNDLGSRYSMIGNLAEKIDASVSIVAGLRSALEDADDKNAKLIIDKLNSLEDLLKTVNNDEKFNEFKSSLSGILKDISEGTVILDKNITDSSEQISKIVELLQVLDMDANFQSLTDHVTVSGNSLKEFISSTSEKITTLNEAGISRVLNDLSTSADALNSKVHQAQEDISSLCENKFESVFENITELKQVVSQIDENGVSANNAIFSNITDRLNVFETNLRESLNKQELTTNQASSQLYDQVDNIKNLSGVIDYKIDSSVVEISNLKNSFESLKDSVNGVLALNFVDVVKDLRADLYASKEEINVSFENNSNSLSEKFSNDLYSKYELLISKLDSVEDEFKKTQTIALNGMKSVLDNISASIVDILSYVSESRSISITDDIEKEISGITDVIKDTSLNYVENIRDVVDIIRVQVENNLKNIEEDSSRRILGLERSISDCTTDLKNDIQNSYSKLIELQDSYKEIKELVNNSSINNEDNFNKVITSANAINTEFENKLSSVKSTLLDSISEFKQEFECKNEDAINNCKVNLEAIREKTSQEINETLDSLTNQIKEFSSESNATRNSALESIQINFNEIKDCLNNYIKENSVSDKSAFENIIQNIDNVKQHISNTSADNSANRQLALESLTNDINSIREQIIATSAQNASNREASLNKIFEEFNKIDAHISNVLEENSNARTNTLSKILENFVGLKEYISSLNNKASENLTQQVNNLIENFESIKATLNKVDENVDGDMTRQLSIIESNFETLVSQISILFEKSDLSLAERVNSEFCNVSERLEACLTSKLENYKLTIEETFDKFGTKASNQSEYIQEKIGEMNKAMQSVWNEQSENNFRQIAEITDKLKEVLDDNLKLTEVDYQALKTKLNEFTQNLESNNETLMQGLKAQLDDITKYVDSVLDIQVQEQSAKYEELANIMRDTVNQFNDKGDSIKSIVEEHINITNGTKSHLSQVSDTLTTLEGQADKLLEQIELSKQCINVLKDSASEIIKKEIDIISSNIEKETDAIIAELSDQFKQIKQGQIDELSSITASLESLIANQVFNNIEDLKSYLDVKTDSTVISDKLDNLKIEVTATVEDVLSNVNKMLTADMFTNATTDFRMANEILINSAVDKISDKIESFVNDNISSIAGTLENGTKSFEEKLALFDKKFIDTVVDKYEELKLINNRYNDSFDNIQHSVNDIFSDFQGVKVTLDEKLEQLIDTVRNSNDITSAEIKQLSDCFENLRSQISNKSFDEAFQASINKQIGSLETLVQEQLSYIEDINDLCLSNLPDVAELNAVVKNTVLDSLNNLNDKLNGQDVEGIIEKELKQTKTDIITQILNVFNQISFVAEQEEIIDFIQEKHDELISVLSHIVTSSSEISTVNKNIITVDSKINSIRNDIGAINEKINNIISSDGDIDYIYSLQDLESDIANLRLVLQEMKDNNHGQEFNDLVSSTEGIYNLVESIKEELPTKKDIEGIAEDIVSISTRTNKLILASDESYKTLQDNLQDFKLVIDDLDERTRNFAQESGMDRIDSKLNALNTMVQNGAKSTQVFNQVFEYLAEWVDNASTQINAISDRVETLDDIGQIKVMLADLKAESEDNSENVELVESISEVFDKQAKKINSLETKLDKMIVENTIHNKNDKIDLSPMEDTLNKFLVAMDEKFTSQQDKINSLETKLSEVMGLLDTKDTAQLTKKVGGMDKQIAKLNKSIEKIASHVVEK